jgi:Protein of unknown function (DUF3592)
MISLPVNPARPQRYGLVILAGALALLGSLVFLGVGGSRSYQQHVEATKWPAVEAQVVNCDVRRSYGYSGRNWGSKSQARCVFRYEANGSAYEESKLAGSRVFESKRQILLTRPAVTVGQIAAWVQRHPRGSTQTIHYNPTNPRDISLAGADAELQTNKPEDQLRIGKVFALIGIVLVLGGSASQKRARNSADMIHPANA